MQPIARLLSVIISRFAQGRRLALLALALGASGPCVLALEGDYFIANPRIDFTKFLEHATATNLIRERSRVSETRFIELSRQSDVAILDARSADKFALLHVDKAINLPFPDISIASLARVFPNKKQIILIYCNNNFDAAPIAFESKSAPASLNISTFISLQSYGYENIYELGPLLNVTTTLIPLIGRKE